jgi:hypothetical protein
MDTFLFSPRSSTKSFQIHQSSTGAIGSKIYPGALKLCSYLPSTLDKEGEDEATHTNVSNDSILTKVLSELIHKDCLVLELGAGVCALPTLQLVLAGRQVIATDLSDMLPLLRSNLETNFPSLCSGSVFPLAWGNEADVKSLRSSLSKFPNVILGADVIYHDYLIEPFFNTLLWLTETDDSISECTLAPVVVLCYVHRFKRAKRFLKLAKKNFEIEIYPTGKVVDYDVLTWSLPKVAAVSRKEEVKEMIFTPQSADYDHFIDELADLDIEDLHLSGSFNKDDTKTSIDIIEKKNQASQNHHIDSDSEDEWEDNDGYKSRLLNSTISGIIENNNSTEINQGKSLEMNRDQKTHYAASKLGFCIHDPLDSFIYILRRKSSSHIQSR